MCKEQENTFKMSHFFCCHSQCRCNCQNILWRVFNSFLSFLFDSFLKDLISYKKNYVVHFEGGTPTLESVIYMCLGVCMYSLTSHGLAAITYTIFILTLLSVLDWPVLWHIFRWKRTNFVRNIFVHSKRAELREQLSDGVATISGTNKTRFLAVRKMHQRKLLYIFHSFQGNTIITVKASTMWPASLPKVLNVSNNYPFMSS